MVGLQAGVDVHLSLHRAEGFGLTIAEGLACGAPVVATDYSGDVETWRRNPLFHPTPWRPTRYRDWLGAYPGPRFDRAEADIDAAARALRGIFASWRALNA